MAFAAKPLVDGDAFELACRVASQADRDLALAADEGQRLACISGLWDRIAELGWMATAIPESAGGAGGGLMDLAALAGGAGRGCLPFPVVGACAVVPHMLSAAGEKADAVLHQVATGEARICVALPDAVREGLDSGASPLQGSIVGVEIPPSPTHLLLVTREPKASLLLIPVGATGLSLAVYQRIDGRLAGEWSLSQVRIAPEYVLASGEHVARVVEEARDLGALLTCVECVAALGALIEQTIDYLSNRVQFGAPLATKQALRHRVAEMYVEYENLRALVGHALQSHGETGRAAWRDIAFAKLRLGHVGRFIAQSAIQCHGGMGVTEELPAIRLARRVMMAEFEYGDRVFQAGRLLAADGRSSA